MSMGGGSAPSTQTVTQKTEIPQYQQDFDKSNYESAQDIAARPYTTYSGERDAPLSTTQQKGIDLANYNAMDPYYRDYGQGATTDLLDLARSPGYSGTAGYTPYTGTASAGSFGKTLDPSSVSPWMSPYIDSALQPEIRGIRREGNITQKGIDATATGAGAFGDSAYGVRSAENDRNTAQLIDDATAKGYGSAYDKAVTAAGNAFTSNAGQFNTEDTAKRSALIDNASFNKDNNAAALGVFNANAGQFNADRTARTNALYDVPSMLSSVYGLNTSQEGDLSTAGKTEQGQTQKEDTTAYTDFLNQFEYPQEMLNLRLAARQGAPYSSTRLTTSPYSSSAQSIGALAAAFGLGGKTLSA